MTNKTMMQFFEWYLPENQLHWKRTAAQAEELGRIGINMVWLPPAYKGAAGAASVGYDVYDMYDLGEFDQKGTAATKYGTKGEYLTAVEALKRNGISVLCDVVLNHRMGADGAAGLLRMRKAGAYTIGQNQETCVVYGMPMEAYRAGAVCVQSALSSIPQVVMARLAKA